MKSTIWLLMICGFLTGCSGDMPAYKSGLEGQALPAFDLLLTSGKHFNTRDVPAGKPVVLFYFSPHCPFCRAQTADIVKRMDSFSNVRFYFITNYPMNDIAVYYTDYKLKKYPNVIVGQDFKAEVMGYLKVQQVPYLAVYNQQKKMERVFVGKVGNGVIKSIIAE